MVPFALIKRLNCTNMIRCGALAALNFTFFGLLSGQEVDDRQAARQEWFYTQRAYPNGSIPTGARLNAIREIQRIDRAARFQRQSLTARSPMANAAITM